MDITIRVASVSLCEMWFLNYTMYLVWGIIFQLEILIVAKCDLEYIVEPWIA